MRWWQLAILLIALFLILGGVLVLVDTVARFYNSVATFSPWLANGLLALGVLVGLVVLGLVGYYLWKFLRPPRRKSRPEAPRHPAAAASVNLEALHQQVAQIQDQVARQALLEKSRSLRSAMAEPEFTVAVFGVGSAGKTSIINGLLDAPVGEVGAPMGTTQEQQVFQWALPDIERSIRLIDTPGIAEAGVQGTLREQAAREIATEADLILFVIDDDLRQAEYSVLQALLTMGKRTVVVFNKADRLPEPDLEVLLARVRSRLSPPLSEDDVLAVATSPAPIRQEGGGWLQMRPNLFPLLARLADILREEGDTLIADNILLQSQRLGETARQLLENQRQAQADAIIDRYQWIGAGAIAMTPLPGLDLLATAAVNAQMVVELGQVYGCEVSFEEGKALAISLAKTLTGLGIVKGAVELLALGLQTNVATVLAGRALQGVSGAYLTRIAGKSFVEYFRRNQNWGDGGISEVVAEQFRLNQRDALIKSFIREAMATVVPNLQNET
jgi:small GTP-binding protein